VKNKKATHFIVEKSKNEQIVHYFYKNKEKVSPFNIICLYLQKKMKGGN
jgi:hypothetical protein